MTTLITGATGSLGFATIESLIKRSTSFKIAALARDLKKTTNIPQEVDIRVGDYQDTASLLHAFKGVDVLLFISTNAIAGRMDQHKRVIDAAGDTRIRHIVYTSMLKASANSSFEAAVDHFHTEEYLKASDIPYTILRNSFYTETIPMFLGDALQTGNWYYPAGDASVNFVAKQDIAEALAEVLINATEHRNKTYEITSGSSHTFKEIAGYISDIVLKPITYTSIPLEDMKEGMRQAGMETALISLIASGAAAIRNEEWDVIDNSLAMLLNRRPADLKDTLRHLIH